MPTRNLARSMTLPLRREERFLVDSDVAAMVLQRASRQLGQEREDALTPWRTTVYCDTEDRSIYEAARLGAAPTLRFREYHQSRPEHVFAGGPVWLEVKETSALSNKERIELSAAALRWVLRGGPALESDLGELAEQAHQLFRNGVRPALVTQCYRAAYADREDHVRISADFEVNYHALSWGSGGDTGVACRIGPLVGRESEVVVELKLAQEPPRWVLDLFKPLRDRALDPQDSKFVRGMAYLRPRPWAPRSLSRDHAAPASTPLP